MAACGASETVGDSANQATFGCGVHASGLRCVGRTATRAVMRCARLLMPDSEASASLGGVAFSLPSQTSLLTKEEGVQLILVELAALRPDRRQYETRCPRLS